MFHGGGTRLVRFAKGGGISAKASSACLQNEQANFAALRYAEPPNLLLRKSHSVIQTPLAKTKTGQKTGFRFGWGGGIRTPECQDQNLVPYHLATPY